MNPSKTFFHWNGGFPPVVLLVHGRGQFNTYRGLTCYPDPVLGYALTVCLLIPVC